MYKFPRGRQVAEIKEINFYPGGLKPKEIIQNCIPVSCVDGWCVIDLVRTDNQRIVLTLGKPG
jgi:hypothetical protein